MERIAVIDLGSNSVRMTITRLGADGAYRMVESARAMVRLSEGMGAEGMLRPEPMERTLHALDLFRRLMDVHRVTHVYPVATAAVRQAVNAEDFLARAEARTGLKFDVISGEEEAELDFLGVINTVSLCDFAMIDIGGASSEIAVVRNRELVGRTSIPWGAVNLTERFELAGKPPKKRREAAEAAVMAGIRSCGWIPKDPALPLVGLGGTIRALAKADRRRLDWPVEALHQYEMPAGRIQEWLDAWGGLGMKERKAMPGIGRDRADILTGAVIPLRMLLGHVGSQRIIVSGNGIREGLFYRHLAGEQGWSEAVVPDVRTHSVENLMRLHESEPVHARHVRHLAEMMFDGMLGLHGLGAELRDLLGYAALLHDSGMHIDYYNHHQHGYYLVLNSELNGFTHREKVLIALLVGMHRVNSEVRVDWRAFDCLLVEGDRPALRRLSLFLMLAEQLDRSECGTIRSLQVHAGERIVRLSVLADDDIRLELGAAALCAGAFEREFGRELELVQKQA